MQRDMYELPQIELYGASFRIIAKHQPGQMVLGIRDYVIERLGSDGEYERIPRVQSFTYMVDLKMSRLLIESADYDPVTR